MESSLALQCPVCFGSEISIGIYQGKDNHWFAKVCCRSCQEKGMFQLDIEEHLNFPSEEIWLGYLQEEHRLQIRLQGEWKEWSQWKQKYGYPRPCQLLSATARHWLLGVILLVGLVWLLTEQWHLAGLLTEDTKQRQLVIDHYAKHLLELSCIPETIKNKIQQVPIRYTLEEAIHGNSVQYGEAGIYWGEEQIKIHRPNFWLFDLPKKAILIETLIHELRHRVSPRLGHNQIFYQLVVKDVACALESWQF